MTALSPPGLPDAAAMGYSHGIVAGPGRLVHIAGQVAEGTTAAEQVDAALAGVDAICREAGGSMADVVSMIWFTTEPVADLWAASAPARRRWLGHPPPAMTVVRVAGLASDRYLVEMTATAVVGDAGRSAR